MDCYGPAQAHQQGKFIRIAGQCKHFAFGSHPRGHILCTQSDSDMRQPIACIAEQCDAEYYAAWEVPMRVSGYGLLMGCCRWDMKSHHGLMQEFRWAAIQLTENDAGPHGSHGVHKWAHAGAFT